MSSEETYVQYGVPSDWANNLKNLGISVTTFKVTSKRNLINKYGIPKDQVDFVKQCIVREPIPKNVVQKLLEKSRFVCCLCKGQKGHAYIIHHIIEYSVNQDNSYNNLAVLCPNDHDLAHRRGQALTNKISVEQIIEAKKSWENKVEIENNKIASTKIFNKATSNWKDENIFKELKSYSESDAQYFFGRETEKHELISKIKKYNIVGLFGESGTGKTSLVNAGLIPIFKSEGFICVSVRCLDEPIKRIRKELIKSLKTFIIAEDIIEELATDTFAHLIIQLKSIVEKHNLKQKNWQ